MTNNEKSAVLVVDDDDVFRERLCRAFRLRGWDAYPAPNAAAALEAAREAGPDMAVIDLRLAGESGLDVVSSLRGMDSTMAIIMLTGYGSIATAIEAIKRGADHYLSKPADVEQIIGAYENLGNSQAMAASLPSTVPSLGRVEWEHIQRVLADCGGNVSQAAKLLGMHRRSLQRKLLKFPPRD